MGFNSRAVGENQSFFSMCSFGCDDCCESFGGGKNCPIIDDISENIIELN